jgi:hypothetical protein
MAELIEIQLQLMDDINSSHKTGLTVPAVIVCIM